MAAVAIMTAGMVSCKDNEPEVVVPPATGNVWEDPDHLEGTVDEEMNLVAEDVYTLTNPLLVAEGGILNIPAGTTIRANNGFDSYILVLQGGKINVNGTEEAPVMMTSAEAYPEPGDWGGLIINGYAPLTSSNPTAKTEINNDYEYGGNKVDDNSGSIAYLILEYTGAKNSANVEHNGLTLNGVGNGTTIGNIFVIDGADDGIEFFGGSVDVTNLLVVNSDDDMFDFTQGYSGKLKNAYGIWEKNFSTGESDPSGIEADGNFDGKFAGDTHQSDFRVENITFDLRNDYVADDDTRRMQQVIRIRRGAKATITNALVKGTGRAEYLINLNDGLANTATAISLTSALETAADSEFAFAKDEDGNPTQSAADYPGIAIGGSNNGCAASNFAWTKYRF